MKIIQICGTNGVGKTTLMKNLLANGNFEKNAVSIDGVQKEYWFDGEIAVVGKYNDANCCGVDAGNYSGEVLLKTLDKVITEVKPDVVVFEDVRFGGSFAFKERLNKLTRQRKCAYTLVNLIASPECSCNRVLNRSGRMNADYDAMISKARGVIKSSRKAANLGARALFFDTGVNGQGETLRFLLNVING